MDTGTRTKKAPASALGWLYSELPELTRAGVVSEETAERLRAYYGPLPGAGRPPLVLIVFGIFGALLIGSGVILLIGHNWEGMSRETRAFLSFLPLVAGQALCVYVLLRRGASAAWREASAVYLTLSIGACMALIAQTYQIRGEVAGFYLAWILLALPLIYAMDASAVALLYFGGLGVWTFLADGPGDLYRVPMFWGLAALALPYVVWVERRGERGFRLGWLSVALCAVLALGVGITLEDGGSPAWAESYGLLFGVLYLLGVRWRRFQMSPYRFIGALGIVGLSLACAFALPFQDQRAVWDLVREPGAAILLGALLVAFLILCALVLPTRPWSALWAAPVAFLVLSALAAGEQNAPLWLRFVFFNIYIFALASIQIYRGYHEDRLALVNGGVGLLAVLLAFRFFDQDLPFTLRGVIFILLGLGFLAANMTMVRRRRSREHETP